MMNSEIFEKKSGNNDYAIMFMMKFYIYCQYTCLKKTKISYKITKILEKYINSPIWNFTVLFIRRFF